MPSARKATSRRCSKLLGATAAITRRSKRHFRRMRGLDPARNWRSPLPQRCVASTACRPIRKAMLRGSGAGSARASALRHFSPADWSWTVGAVRQRDVPPLISRIAFPGGWRVIVVLDPARQGVFGADEVAAFARLPEFPAADAAHLCRLVMMQALPAAAEARPRRLRGRHPGTSGPHRGLLCAGTGRATLHQPAMSARCSSISTHMARMGWGKARGVPPALHSRRRCTKQTASLRLARAHPRARGLDIRICAALNRGAEITEE